MTKSVITTSKLNDVMDIEYGPGSTILQYLDLCECYKQKIYSVSK